ncbi:MAG: 16S rRNA (guanine(527)-N(7))-methyltransferase RsmG [Phascolarctobacterium sp.]|nr:MAG: 16S rRNA (guanine(527)-N(7))-methyltransferase RsmG [Phascolarctobacterium sp.]
MNEFQKILAESAAQAGFELSALQLEQFEKYYEMLVETNKVMNLTALTEPQDVAVKHFVDSLMAYADYFPGKVLADVGTGAGFPGIPLKIYCTSLKVVLIDSLAKRLNFLQRVIAELGLKDIECVHLRAEDAGKNPAHREKYDIVTARAVARLSVLSEYCLPLVKVGGVFVALKGAKYQEEIAAAGKALSVLGGKLIEAKKVELPGLNDGRAVVTIKKVKASPKAYPRKAGLPDKNPLE